MIYLLLIAEGLLPAFLLICYIYYKDKNQPEPISQIKRGVKYGVVSILVSLLISGPLGALGAYTADYQSVFGAMRLAFFGAAIPEETAKLIMLWLLVRNNPYFDERMDGIVYSVCVGMGFAGLENVMYIFQNIDVAHSVAIQRALFSVPGHFAFAVLMGYYYGLVHFEPQRYGNLRAMIWLAPVVAHGIFDMILMMAPVFAERVQAIFYIVFIFFCYRMHKYCTTRVKSLLARDKSDLDYAKRLGEEGNYDRKY